MEEENVQSVTEIIFDDGFSSEAEALAIEVPIKVTAHTTKSEKRQEVKCMLQYVSTTQTKLRKIVVLPAAILDVDAVG